MMHRILVTALFAALAAPLAHAGEITVGQKNKTFSMDSATLKRGDKINFVNDDSIPHNVMVTAPGDEPKNSGVQDPGETASFRFEKAGTYDVECGIHPNMKMTVVVQ